MPNYKGGQPNINVSFLLENQNKYKRYGSEVGNIVNLYKQPDFASEADSDYHSVNQQTPPQNRQNSTILFTNSSGGNFLSAKENLSENSNELNLDELLLNQGGKVVTSE